MIKISLKALMKLLLNNDHKFTVERVDHDNFKKRNIIAFMVGHKYPNTRPFVTFRDGISDDSDTLKQYKEDRKDAEVILYFDADFDVIRGCTCEIHTLVKEAKSNAIKQLDTAKKIVIVDLNQMIG